MCFPYCKHAVAVRFLINMFGTGKVHAALEKNEQVSKAGGYQVSGTYSCVFSP